LFPDQLSSILDGALVGVGSLWKHWRFLCYQKLEKGQKKEEKCTNGIYAKKSIFST
jgi:hypothetical protein